MEIPYTVTARSDTGLWNAKIGIWLFLASEVMLFGGLFSSYIFLRLGADYPWPNGELNVPLGFVNTVILILSSVFVVMAWASLKMRQYGSYLKWMTAVVLCALVFLVNKGFEYYAKFEHKTVVLKDRSVLAGHIPRGESAEIRFRAKYATVDFATGNHRFLRFIDNDARFFSEKGEVKMGRAWFQRHRKASQLQARADYLGGEASRLEGEAEAAHGTAAEDLRKHAEALRRESRALAAEVKESYPDLEDFAGSSSMRFELRPEAEISVPRKEVTAWGDNELTFRDATLLEGLLESAVVKLEVDEIDLREYFSRSEHGGAERDAAGAGIFRHLPMGVREAFVHHREAGQAEFEAKRAAWERKNPEKAFPEPAYPAYDKVYLDALHFEGGGSSKEEEKHGVGGGADAGEPGGEHHHPVVTIPYEDIRFFSSYTPKKNTYYAIYFTLTGLHALHVLGGALVLSFFLFFGKSLYRKNPEHLANRVEVGGLFWHFVDLVWIFLFPILYLM
ncbi:MAG TPA: cytochrome c oxidase subunit 3 [Verrucomicrobiales bacterium]|nr:cytochrome c oxidase subunit 3 [Verrucomicrobiales bacterium]